MNIRKQNSAEKKKANTSMYPGSVALCYATYVQSPPQLWKNFTIVNSITYTNFTLKSYPNLTLAMLTPNYSLLVLTQLRKGYQTGTRYKTLNQPKEIRKITLGFSLKCITQPFSTHGFYLSFLTMPFLTRNYRKINLEKHITISKT